MRLAGYALAALLATAGLTSLILSAPAPALGQWEGKPGGLVGRACTFYEHADFTGARRDIGEFDEVPWVGNEWNDRISSIDCHERCTATVYEHIDYGGESGRWQGRARTMGLSWNDRISSVRVTCTGSAEGRASTFGTAEESRRSCTFYADREFGGASAVLAAGEDGSWVGDRWNDRISSIRCRPGCAAEVWRDIDYGGGPLRMSGRMYIEERELDAWWDNSINSIEVRCDDS